MRQYSGKFLSLVESMKSDDNFYLMEDEGKKSKTRTGTFRDRERTSSGQLKSRAERREERREDSFTTGQEMALKPFLRALESLKSQIIAENSGVYNAVNNKGEGAKYGIPIMRGLEATLKNVMDLIASVTSKISREGKFLDMSKNSADIESYRTLYTKAQADYAKYAQEWVEAARKDRLERPVDNKNKEIEASINSAITYFTKARDLFIKNSGSFVKSSVISGGGSSSSTGGTGSVSLTTTIKQRKAVYTGTEGETVKSVKLMIYQKFKKYAKLASQPDWKIVFKNPTSPSSTLRENTASVIKMVKAGLAKTYPDLASDKTGDITPNFVKILSELKEGLQNQNSKLISFSDFMNKKINEQFDEDAAVAAVSSSTRSSSGSSSGSSTKKSEPKRNSGSGKKQALANVPEYPATPFKTEEEGNKFREWVNKTYPDWAKKNNLDATGGKDNSYIRKAYSEYGDKYKGSETKGLTNDQLKQIVTSIKANGGGCEINITSYDSTPYVNFWKGKEYGGIYNNARVKLWGVNGKTYTGNYIVGGNINFDNGKKITLKQLVSGMAAYPASGTTDPKETKNFTDAQYERMAGRLLDAMAGAGTYEDIIDDVFGKLKSDKDLTTLNKAFGKRRGYDLEEWLWGDGVLARANKILYNRGINWHLSFNYYYKDKKKAEKNWFRART